MMAENSDQLAHQLYYSSRYGHDSTKVLDLLGRGADPDGDYYDKEHKGYTPLMAACLNNDPHTAELLLKWGARIDTRNADNATALHYACRYNNDIMDGVGVLMAHNSPTDVKDKDGKTAVDYARKRDFSDIVKFVTTYKPQPRDPLSSYPSAKQLSKLRVDRWRELGAHLGLTEDQLEEVKESLHPTTAVLLAAKVKDVDLKWNKIVGALRHVGEFKLAESICNELDCDHEDVHQKKDAVSVPVLPRNWTVVTDQETKKLVYQNTNNTDVTSSTPPGYPLRQTTTQPNITFYDEPKEETFTSSGGHADFNNGVEVTVPPDTIPPGSTVGVKVQPGFASSDVFKMPKSVESASPSYLITSTSDQHLKGEVTVTMEHHVKVSTREEADDLVFLQADPFPGQSGAYKYKKVSEGRSEFTPGEKKGKLSVKYFNEKLIKVGRIVKKLVGDSILFKNTHLDSNVYTLRVYRSPPETTGDRLCVVVVSLLQRVFLEFLRNFENDIQGEYPALSERKADRSIKEPLSFAQLDDAIKLTCTCNSNWRRVIDQRTISKESVDFPVAGNFKPEELHSYPPRMICEFFPERGAMSTTCTLALKGFDRPVSVDMALHIADSHVTVDTTELQVAAEILKNSASRIIIPQLAETVEKIVAVSTLLTSALRSSSLSDLAAHTDSIKTQIKTVLKVSKKVAGECTRRTISKSIEDKLSKMEVLSHQLCHVTKVKLKHCKWQSEKIDALRDLVKSGHNLLRTVDGLLKDIQTLGDIDIDSTEYLPLAEVKEATKEVRSDWYSLAVELGISLEIRKTIERDHPTVEARFHAMLRHWVRRASPPPSWSALIRALQSTVIDRGDVAKKVEAKLLEETGHTVSSDSSTHLEPFDPQDLLSVDTHLKMVREATWDVRAKWYDLGIQVGITVGTLKVIQQNFLNGSNLCYTSLLEHWLIQGPMWADLIAALQSPSIKRGDLVSKVEALIEKESRRGTV